MADDVAKYTFNGVKYTQTYLTIDEFEKIGEVFEDFALKNASNAVSIFIHLKQSGKLNEFFNVILKGESPVDVGKMNLRNVVEVISDFLSCNGVPEIISQVVSMMAMVGKPMGIDLLKTMNSTGTN